MALTRSNSYCRYLAESHARHVAHIVARVMQFSDGRKYLKEKAIFYCFSGRLCAVSSCDSTNLLRARLVAYGGQHLEEFFDFRKPLPASINTPNDVPSEGLADDQSDCIELCLDPISESDSENSPEDRHQGGEIEVLLREDLFDDFPPFGDLSGFRMDRIFVSFPCPVVVFDLLSSRVTSDWLDLPLATHNCGPGQAVRFIPYQPGAPSRVH